MRRGKRLLAATDKAKRITVKRLPKKTSFVIHYPDGHRTETQFIEIQGNATLFIEAGTREPQVRTEANITLANGGTCAVCGGDTEDQHAHA